MGDIGVDIFLEMLKELITSSKLDLITNEKQQFESLEEEIKYLRGFLKVTEKKRNEHSEIMELVKKIREVVSEAENIVELFVIDAFDAKDSLLELFNDQYFLSLDLEGVKKEINILTAEVKKIDDENMYDIKGAVKKLLKHSPTEIGSGGGLRSSGGSSTTKVVKEVVVGFKEEVERLIEKLDYKGEGLEIVTIIGAAGGGKTTLAIEVYDHPFTKYNFEVRAWVDVSQDYDKTMKRDLLISILKSVYPEKSDYEKMSENMLGEKVLKCLKCKRYLIVMDDIWGIEAWNDIQRSFPKECKGSKVLFTSRLDMDKVVQHDSVHCIPHRLDPLPKSRSWELLQTKVFGRKSCPQELEEIGDQIAGKCGGLPLAIVAIAGILATEDKTLKVWKEVAKRLSSIIANNQEGCMEILELSYNHLPLHLKACFLYIGAFSVDYEIPVRELIWLWIAEGFIQQSEGGKSLEAVAEDYLIDLIDRSLVMVARKRSLGEIKACRIHDLLRVLCLKKAEEDNFFVQIYEGDSFSPSATSKHRRLFIGCQLFHKYSLMRQARDFRSILCPGLPTSSPLQNLSFFVENFKLLRVLSVISAECEGEIGIGNPLHLRYLAFKLPGDLNIGQSGTILHMPAFNAWVFNHRMNQVTRLHEICRYKSPFSNLLNLETLNVRARGTIPLPCDIFKMVKLRHLYCSKEGVFTLHDFSDFSYEGRERICFDHSSKLDSLQTLHQICPCNDCRSFLVRTPNIRKLGFYGELMSHSVLMLPNLEFLKCLDTLGFKNMWSLIGERGPLTLPALTLPVGLKFPPSVTRVTLENTLLKWEELSLLQTLPSLEVLKLLNNACCGPVWDTCELEEGFSQLKYLSLKFMDIEEWNASENQFPLLEVLVVDKCRNLEQIPMDFANLMELRELKLAWCSPSAQESVWKIQEERKKKNGDDDCLNLLVIGTSHRGFRHR